MIGLDVKVVTEVEIQSGISYEESNPYNLSSVIGPAGLEADWWAVPCRALPDLAIAALID
jgi:hypothetical protein